MTPVGQHQMLQASDEEDGGKAKRPLSPRTSPVGTDTEVQTDEVSYFKFLSFRKLSDMCQ